MINLTAYNTTAILKQVLAVDPQADLHKIRRAHPALRAMSLDNLGLRLTRLIDSQADAWAK
jgi:hypothetical protein